MREIKFRAWDKKYKNMIVSSTKDFSIIGNNVETQCELYDVELMQYTGLKDKNGVEIYEGDIVQIYTHCHITHVYKKQTRSHFKPKEGEIGTYTYIADINDIREVVFNIGALVLYGKNGSDGAYTHFSHLNRPGQKVEVIGNIYENKELLK